MTYHCTNVSDVSILSLISGYWSFSLSFSSILSAWSLYKIIPLQVWSDFEAEQIFCAQASKRPQLPWNFPLMNKTRNRALTKLPWDLSKVSKSHGNIWYKLCCFPLNSLFPWMYYLPRCCCSRGLLIPLLCFPASTEWVDIMTSPSRYPCPRARWYWDLLKSLKWVRGRCISQETHNYRSSKSTALAPCERNC